MDTHVASLTSYKYWIRFIFPATLVRSYLCFECVYRSLDSTSESRKVEGVGFNNSLSSNFYYFSHSPFLSLYSVHLYFRVRDQALCHYRHNFTMFLRRLISSFKKPCQWNIYTYLGPKFAVGTGSGKFHAARKKSRTLNKGISIFENQSKTYYLLARFSPHLKSDGVSLIPFLSQFINYLLCTTNRFRITLELSSRVHKIITTSCIIKKNIYFMKRNIFFFITFNSPVCC